MLYPKGEFDFQLTLFYKNQLPNLSFSTIDFKPYIIHTILYIFHRDNMSRILSSGVCSIMSVVLLLSISTTTCSFSPTAVTLRCCTKQPNGEQSVNQSINPSIDQSIRRHLRIASVCDLRKDYRGTPFIR